MANASPISRKTLWPTSFETWRRSAAVVWSASIFIQERFVKNYPQYKEKTRALGDDKGRAEWLALHRAEKILAGPARSEAVANRKLERARPAGAEESASRSERLIEARRRNVVVET
jgi:hypothetical protein